MGKTFVDWVKRYQKFLREMTIDEYGNKRPIHERILKAECSLLKLIQENIFLTYLIMNYLQILSRHQRITE